MTKVQPPRPDAPVLIVGGGLAGLTAAHLLHRAGVAFHLLEARDRLGGRILTADASGAVSADGFDLGPSWFWPDVQPDMRALVTSLGLATVAQNTEGDVLFQRMSRETPQRYRGMQQAPQSMRIVGGSGAMIAALASGLPRTSLQLGARVTHVARADPLVEVGFVDATGAECRLAGAQVLLALPPRLLDATVAFSPALEEATARRWRETPTWMAPHAKVFALYERPFWREAGLSGTAQSLVGPLVEIHDATTASGKAALFGFLGMPARQRAVAGRDSLVAAAVRQLAALFGPGAGAPQATLLKDWAADPLTATPDDQEATGHPAPSGAPWVAGDWQGRIALIGSETSRTEPGYLAGAVEAAGRAVAEILTGPTACATRQPTLEIRETKP
jgi:monoamine oxidase